MRQRHYYNGHRIPPEHAPAHSRLSRALTSRTFDRLGAVFAGAVLVWAVVVLLT